MQVSESGGGGAGGGANGDGGQDVGNGATETCRFPKLEECAHFHYERVHLPKLDVHLNTNMDQSIHSQHHCADDEGEDWFTLQVTCRDECWLIQRSLHNFTMLDAQLHQCIYDRKVSRLPNLSDYLPKHREPSPSSDTNPSPLVEPENNPPTTTDDDLEPILSAYLERFCAIADNSLNCGPILNWFQLDNKGHRLLVPSEESRSINTPAVAAAYSVRKYVSQARDELSLEVGDMISVIDMASPGESVWWRGKRGFQVGFFPQHCVHIIGDKVPRHVPLPAPVVGSLAISPVKPVLRRHGKLITFFRSFLLHRPSRRRLKQSGILRERVFGCDLGEHLLNSGRAVPAVLTSCAEFIETHGIVDGIYRLSGVTSNIQKLRHAFDEERVPNLYTDDILQDIHSVASLLKMYFRELPNPLCTYQLYHSFVAAVAGCAAARSPAADAPRLLRMREAVQKLPPPHYRTLEYLMRHLARVAQHGARTGMTTRNVAIVWAPNLLRCEELEVGGVAALQGVGVQAVVTEFLVCYADLIFSDNLPNLAEPAAGLVSLTPTQDTTATSPVSPKRSRPKSLAISTPTKLLTLEEARNKHLLNRADDSSYIEVGGGPKTLPKKYHTVIELPSGGRKRTLAKRSPSGWRSFFSKARNNSHGNLTKNREISAPGIIPTEKSVTEGDLNEMKRKLRPVKSAESLISGQSEPPTCDADVLGPLHSLTKPPGHNRSVSHDSYFDNMQTSTNNSVGSLLDLSEIQLNFELEESEMRIFSEDESLVSSPKVHKETVSRKMLNRARPEDLTSATNSSNPSPKKQARVIMSPDSMSRKRSRLEDQLSDIQYIDCNTPENPCTISTTALIHQEESSYEAPTPSSSDAYQPKNKSPRNNSHSNRHSLNFDKPSKPNIPKSLTEIDLGEKLKVPLSHSSAFTINLTPTPQSPNYKRLDASSSSEEDALKPDFFEKEAPTYENIAPTNANYENILTTISITYKSPIKTRNSESIYEDVELNPEQAVVPTTVASLPVQEASQPRLDQFDSPPKSKTPVTSPRLSLETSFDVAVTTVCNDDPEKNKPKVEPVRPKDLKLSEAKCEDSKHSFESTDLTKSLDYKSIDSLSSNSLFERDNSKKSLITPTDELSLSEIVQSTSNSSSNLTSPSRQTNSPALSPIVSPINVSNCTSPLSHLDLNESSQEDVSASPSKPAANNEKRKSCDAEILDENAIYQQVKYFRRSVHEINTLLNLPEDSAAPITKSKSASSLKESHKTDSDTLVISGVSSLTTVSNSTIMNSNSDQFDSLEPENVHLYENVEPSEKELQNSLKNFDSGNNTKGLDSRHSKSLDSARSRMHECEPKFVEISPDVAHNIPVCSKCSDSLDIQKNNVKNLTSKFEETNINEELYSLKLDDVNRNDILEIVEKAEPKNISVEQDILDNKTDNICSTPPVKSKHVSYDKDNLPPCLRAKNAKNSIKTRSLDENAFVTEFGRGGNLQRRKSLDDRTSSYINSKLLVEPQKVSSSTTDVRLESKHRLTEAFLGADQKLNRERIEKYKEERRNFLREKYRSESFREDKDKLLSRLKQKSFRSRPDDVVSDSTNSNSITNNSNSSINNSAILGNSSAILVNTSAAIVNTSATLVNTSANLLNTSAISSNNSSPTTNHSGSTSAIANNPEYKDIEKPIVGKVHGEQDRLGRRELDPRKEPEMKKLSMEQLSRWEREGGARVRRQQSPRPPVEEDFTRQRRHDLEGERRRHTYDLLRERDLDAEKRASFDTKPARKEKCSPSYCIKDVKAMFESKSHQ